jgi:two-component SAPR family response regulator
MMIKDQTKQGAAWGVRLEGSRVLVVEDDFILSMALEAMLAEAGAEIAGVCRTLSDALSLAEGDDLSAAILDIQLGEDTVVPVARRLFDRGIPFLFYTGQTETGPIRSEWPRCTIISKPAQPGTIISALARLTGR